MNQKLDRNIIKYLVQEPQGQRLLKDVPAKMFVLTAHQTVIGVLQGYQNKHGTIPNLATLQAFMADELKRINSDGIENWDAYENSIKFIYEPLDYNVEYIKEKAVAIVQNRLVFDLMATYEIEDDPDYMDAPNVNKLIRQLEKIKNIGADAQTEIVSEGQWLLNTEIEEAVIGATIQPTYLTALNHMTAHGGFKAPQVILFASAAKGFKTGLLINIAVEFVRAGLKVHFADTENYATNIRDRARQLLFRLSARDYRDFADKVRQGDEQAVIEYRHMMEMNALLEANMRIVTYSSGLGTLDDVDEQIQLDKEEHNFEPDVIIYDYFDNFTSANKTIKDHRLKIRDVYKHAKRLNVKHGTMCLSVSQVIRSAMLKQRFIMSDLDEDIGKAHQADACFGFGKDKVDRIELEETYTENGHEVTVTESLAQIGVVMQREGKNADNYYPCFVAVAAEIQRVRELTPAQYQEMYERRQALLDSGIAKELEQNGVFKMEGITDD